MTSDCETVDRYWDALHTGLKDVTDAIHALALAQGAQAAHSENLVAQVNQVVTGRAGACINEAAKLLACNTRIDAVESNLDGHLKAHEETRVSWQKQVANWIVPLLLATGVGALLERIL